jgi:hypothetical protein
VNNQAPELSPEARRLINEARGADDPTAEDHARVKARWLAGVAAIAGVSSLTEAARAAGGIGWGLKAAGAALVIAAGAVGLNFALDAGDAAQAKKAEPLPAWSDSMPERVQPTPRSEPEENHAVAPSAGKANPLPPVKASSPQPTPAAVDAVEAAQPRVAEESAPAAAEPAASVAQPSASAPRAVVPATGTRVMKPAARVAVARAPKATENDEEVAIVAPAPVEAAPAAAGPSGQLGEELALLSDVRSNIQDGAAARALEQLNQYEARFGQPILGMEADALRVDALCKVGQREAAQQRARAFQNEWPGSPLQRRVSDACP